MVNGMAYGEPRKSGGEGIGDCPKHFVPWVRTPVMGEFGVMVEEGGCHYFFSVQGPLLKGGDDVGGESPCERVCFFVRMFRGILQGASVTLHVILLGVGGTIYNTHTLKPFKELGLDSQRFKKLASKLHVHSVNFAAILVHTRRALSKTVINSHQEPVSGQACNPPNPH